jgi:hypothetical protein
MIKTSAYLHQKQREQAENFIVASEEDYYLIRPLFEHANSFGPDLHTTQLLAAAKSLSNGFLPNDFTVASLQEKLDWKRTKTTQCSNAAGKRATLLRGQPAASIG